MTPLLEIYAFGVALLSPAVLALTEDEPYADWIKVAGSAIVGLGWPFFVPLILVLTLLGALEVTKK